jgi:phage tail sheath protein FI
VGRVKRTINAFLLRVWRDGALFGATARPGVLRQSATRRTTRRRCATPGQLIVDIGIAPVKPAEFVVFRIAQFSGSPEAE